MIAALSASAAELLGSASTPWAWPYKRVRLGRRKSTHTWVDLALALLVVSAVAFWYVVSVVPSLQTIMNPPPPLPPPPSSPGSYSYGAYSYSYEPGSGSYSYAAAPNASVSVGDGGDAAACDAAVHGGWRGAQPVRPCSTLQLCFVTRVSTREVQQLLRGPIEHQGGTANVTLCTRQRRTALTCCNARLLFADSTCCLGLHARLLHVRLGILRRLLPHAHGSSGGR